MNFRKKKLQTATEAPPPREGVLTFKLWALSLIQKHMSDMMEFIQKVEKVGQILFPKKESNKYF